MDKWKNIGAKCFIYEVDILFLESNFDAEINKFNFSKEKDILFELRKMSKFFTLFFYARFLKFTALKTEKRKLLKMKDK